MKHPNKRVEAIRKAKARFIIECKRQSAFIFWLKK
jgi:hypothetical protein